MHFISKLAVALTLALTLGCGGPTNTDGNTGGGKGGTGGGNNSGSGGGNGGSGGGGGSSPSDFKKTCTQPGDCSSQICLVKGSAQFGYCTKSCESFSDCPDFWSCDTIGNANGKYCIQ